VKKAGGEQTPVLVGTDGRGAEVAAPVEYVEGSGLGEGDAACHHGEEDQHVGRDQGVGDGVGAGCAGSRGVGVGDGGVIHVSIVLALPGGQGMAGDEVGGRGGWEGCWGGLG